MTSSEKLRLSLIEKRATIWHTLSFEERQHTFDCLDALSGVQWANKLVKLLGNARALDRWLWDNQAEKDETLEWLLEWQKMYAIRPYFFETRYAYDLHSRGLAPQHEVKSLGDSTIDFLIKTETGSSFWVELLCIEQSRDVSDATEPIKDFPGDVHGIAKEVLMDPDEELLKAQCKIVEKCAKKDKEGNWKPHKFQLFTEGSNSYNVLLVDLRGLHGGMNKMDSTDIFQLVYGRDAFIKAGGNAARSVFVRNSGLAGLFDESKKGEDARIFRERIHVLGLVAENDFAAGRLIEQTWLFPNPFINSAKQAISHFPCPGQWKSPTAIT